MEDENRQSACTCCGGKPKTAEPVDFAPQAQAIRGCIPSVTTSLSLADRWGGWKVRWGIGRSRYSVPPGLYAVGRPGDRAAVLVTANYKQSFDSLRKELGGLDAWILVLDTQGINVWCAAGKGTFGTDELVRRIRLSGLPERVSHRVLILPQLGATGVAAYQVKRETGFNVVYGPVRARDLKPFLAQGMKATREMRTVSFGLAERLAVIPVELMAALKFFLIFPAAWALVSAVAGGFSLHRLFLSGIPLLGAVVTGTVVVPSLLPWIPFRSFALKGWLMGTLWALGISLIMKSGPLAFIGHLFLLPAISAYLALNFTGSTTFTSQSGVNKEIRLYARPMAVSVVLGAILLVSRSIW